MIKINKIAIGVFLVFSLFNFLFPPYILVLPDGKIQDRILFDFILNEHLKIEYFSYNYIIDIRTLIVLLLISLVISVIIQGIYNIFKKKYPKHKEIEIEN